MHHPRHPTTMVAIVLDDDAVSALRSATLGDKITETAHVRVASHDTVLKAGLSLRGREVHLHESDAIGAHTPAPARPAELERRLEALRARAADAEYRRMISDVDLAGDEHESAARILRDAAPAVSVAFNTVAAMGTCFAVGYFLVNAATGNRGLALGAGAVGIAGALAVEATLVVTRMYRVEKEGTRIEKSRDRTVLRRARNDRQRQRGHVAGIEGKERLEPERPKDKNA